MSVIYILIILLVMYLLYRVISIYWTVPNLSQKCILITGCDMGFGHALALKLARKGITTYATCLTEEGDKSLNNEYAGFGCMLKTIRMDVTDQKSVDDAKMNVIDHLGKDKGLWALVNNAGILGATAPCDWLSIDDWRKPLDVNCLGVIRVTHAFKQLVKQEKGRIIIITSMAGRQVLPLCAPYCASKHAAEAYANSLRLEMKPFGVTVHTIEAGFMNTNLTSSTYARSSVYKKWMELSKHVQQEYGDAYPRETIEFIEKIFGIFCSNRLYAIPNACTHAITSQWPRTRYIVGVDANILLSLNWLPTILIDLGQFAIMDKLNYPNLKSSLIKDNK